MRRALLAATITIALTLAPVTRGNAETQRCQYDVAGRTLIVLAAPHTPIGTTVQVQRTAWSPRHWHRAGRITSRHVTTLTLLRPATQFTLRVRVGTQRCEST